MPSPVAYRETIHAPDCPAVADVDATPVGQLSGSRLASVTFAMDCPECAPDW